MKKLLSLSILLAGTVVSLAQNPIIRNQYTADPTARVFNGRVYMFPSHDIISPVEPERKWFCMADYHMFSSTDLCNWTDHGVILSQEQVPWGNPTGYSMWAPDCIEHNGKYYFYFPDGAKPQEGRRGGFGIGVAIADNLFQAKFVPQEKNIEGIMGIDPCVLQASNGKNYIYWGSGGIVGAELGEDMMSIVDKPKRFNELPGTELKEGPFAFEKDGKYYLTYPWVREKGGTECLAYAMSDNPLGPWEYKGIIMKEHENGCWTNHHSIINFKGQWYLFYHHNDYSPSFDKNRSACIDSLFFNADGTIQEVKPTLRGVGISDARKPIQIDRYSAIGGKAHIEYHDTLNYFLGWKTVMPKGGWIRYNKVDTKSASAQNVCLRVKTTVATIMKLDLGTYTTHINIPSTSAKWEEINVSVKTMPEGVSDLKLTNLGAQAEVDWITLTEAPREQYFLKNLPAVSKPDEDGFIRRWMVLEPIDKPNRSNTVFTDTYLRENFNKEYFAGQQTILPKNGDKVTVDGKTLTWHELEANRFNVKLFRFATGNELQEYGVLYWAVTVIDCPEEIKDVRLAAGSNSASMWWVNGKEELILSGDRRMVKDDGTSPRFTLKKGRNIIRGVIINGPGMSDFCVRLINEKGEPVKNFTVTAK